MANTHIDHHLALLQQLRTILVALGEAEQILDDSHAMYLERYDELLSDLPNDPEASLYLGQDLISQILWSGKRDSNSRPRPWQGRALPTELFPQWYPGGDLNPHEHNVHWILSPTCLPFHHLGILKITERETRLELATPTLARSCSTN
jgi:hypothetical protein